MRVESRRAYILREDHPISIEVGWSSLYKYKTLVPMGWGSD